MAETLKKLGVTHWSTRLLAERLKISHTSVARAWRSSGVMPWKAESFRFSTDPELVGKVTDVCGGDVMGRGLAVIPDVKPGSTEDFEITAKVKDGATHCVKGASYGRIG